MEPAKDAELSVSPATRNSQADSFVAFAKKISNQLMRTQTRFKSNSASTEGNVTSARLPQVRAWLMSAWLR